MASHRIRIGLALGSGSARGWAHIGVLRALSEQGVQPDIICGCSIGSFVGAAYANGDLDKLEHWVSALTWQDVVGLMDIRLRGGLLKGDKLMRFFSERFVDREFGELSQAFGCVATDLASGREVWLREGSVASAVRASIALPGLFSPVRVDGRLLVDGGLVNPVPVSLARAMGADVVIAVDLGSDVVGRSMRASESAVEEDEAANGAVRNGWLARLGLQREREEVAEPGETLPSILDVLSGSIQIMQVRIARSRLAGEPADVIVAPRLAQLGMMDYHRGADAIAEGREAVARVLPAIRFALRELA